MLLASIANQGGFLNTTPWKVIQTFIFALAPRTANQYSQFENKRSDGFA